MGLTQSMMMRPSLRVILQLKLGKVDLSYFKNEFDVDLSSKFSSTQSTRTEIF